MRFADLNSLPLNTSLCYFFSGAAIPSGRRCIVAHIASLALMTQRIWGRWWLVPCLIFESQLADRHRPPFLHTCSG